MEAPMRIPEAAVLLGVSSMTVMRRIKAGDLRATKVGREWDISMDAVIDNLPKQLREYITNLQARVAELERERAERDKHAE